MIPPASKCLKKLTSMLWRFLQTNSNMDIAASTNRYYSPWAKGFLAQHVVRGGLNAQDYESQLMATLAKWIFKLIDPRHVASWKALPFYFFDVRFPGVGLSILSSDPIITKIFGNDSAGRWFGFLQAWLHSGLKVAEPPKDYHCIMNESLWFNRHMLYPNRNKHGRFLSKAVEDRLIRRGFTRVSDLISSTATYPDKQMFMSLDEAEEKTGSRVLAKALHMIIYDVIPLGWKMIVHRKIREPFQPGDWFIERSAAASNGSPAIVYQVRNVSQSLLLGQAYLFSDVSLLHRQLPISVKLHHIDHVIKASVLRDHDDQLIYCGNYLTSNLLLSRLSWTGANSQTIKFFDFSVKLVDKAILESKDKSIPAIVRWNRIMAVPIDDIWKQMFKYIQDPIINNRCKEVLYKIYTQVLPVGTNIERFGKPNNCCFCDDVETEFHLFIHCPRIAEIWTWLQSLVLRHYHSLVVVGLTDWEKLVGFNTKMPNKTIQVWKAFHAETIRVIWASRCKLVFDDELDDIAKLKAQVMSRVEYAMTIRVNVLQSSTRKKKEQILRRIVKTWTGDNPLSSFEKSSKGFWKCKIIDDAATC